MYNKIDPSFSLCIIDKGAKKWRGTFDDSSLFECKLTILMKTCFASKVVMFEECLAY
jgi:hypothetical protein